MTPLLLLLTLTAPGQPGTYKHQVTQDFRGGVPLVAEVAPLGPWNEIVEPGPDGARVRFPAGRKEPQTVGVRSRRFIHGDFEITLSYQLVGPERPTGGYGAGVMVWLMLDDPQSSFAAVARRSQPGGKELFNSSRGGYPPPDKKQTQQLTSIPARGREGRLRLVRQGATLSFLVEELTGSGFREFRVEDGFGTAPVEHTKFGADRGLSQDPLEVILGELTIRADELSDDLTPRPPGSPVPTPVTTTPPAPPRSYAALWWVAGGAAACLLLTGGLLLAHRRREAASDPDEEEEDEGD